MCLRLITIFTFAVLSSVSQADVKPLLEPGVMFKSGTWTNDDDGENQPDSLVGVKPIDWPKDGWYLLKINNDYSQYKNIYIEKIITPKQKHPEFISQIIRKINKTNNQPALQRSPDIDGKNIDTSSIYLRVPGIHLKQGAVSMYTFKNGSTSLSPKLDYSYELKLNEQVFSMKVSNGFKAKSGQTYGDGMQLLIEYDNNQYQYSLGVYGWNSKIMGVGDLDGDRKPDFIITVGGPGRTSEHILLSSKAKPGKNPATASYYARYGC